MSPPMSKNDVAAELQNAGVELTAIQKEALDILIENPGKIVTYAEVGSTDEEIAAVYEVPVAALKPFTGVLAKARAELAWRIRQALLTAADKGSPEALSYLSARYLEGKRQ